MNTSGCGLQSDACWYCVRFHA